ncbi:non-membrane spanning protein tyrosine kinase [Balamuthia mandrillaris]
MWTGRGILLLSWCCLFGSFVGVARPQFLAYIETIPEAPFLVGSVFTVVYHLNLESGVNGVLSFNLDEGATYIPGSLTSVGPPELDCSEAGAQCAFSGSYTGPATVSRTLQNRPDTTYIALWYSTMEQPSAIYNINSEYRVALEASLSSASPSSFEPGEVLSFSANMSNSGPSQTGHGYCLFGIEPKEAGLWVEDELPGSCQLLDEASPEVMLCSFSGIPANDTVEFMSGLKLATDFFFPSNLTVSLSGCTPWYSTMNILEMNYTDAVQHFTVIPSPPSSQSTSSSSASESDREEDGGDDEDKTPIIAGASVGGGLLLLLVVFAVVAAFVIWQRRGSRSRNRFKDQRDLENGVEDLYEMKKDFVAPSAGTEKGVRQGRVDTLDQGMSWEIAWQDLEFAEKLGEGAFGTVWRGLWRNSEVAIKQVSGLGSEKSLEAFKAEVELMKRLRPHANVVLLMGVCMEEGHPFCLVTEFLPKGDLLRFLQSKEGKKAMKDEKTLLRMAREIAAGMSHLHAEGITHRDLAARNLLLGKDLTIKVSDFGLAHKQEKGGEEERQLDEDAQVPVKWLAPEVLKSNTYGPAADVWSYGVILWELANLGMEPYPGMSMEEASLAVLDGQHPDIPSSLPSILQDIMEECFAADPEERPSFASIVKQLKRKD